MGIFVSLRRLGIPVREQMAEQHRDREEHDLLMQEIKRLNDYMALMTNEPSPPTEEDDTDATT